jgi:calcineurin-like phosphoesterase family protein
LTNIFVISDHHFNHANILKFKRDDGSPLREFKDVIEMNEYMVQKHNEVVKTEDHVYFLGDVCINKGGLKYVSRMTGHKRLVRGNHDILKTKEYIEAGFKEIYGVRVFPKNNIILSHIPLHPSCLSSRNWTNVHGHLHSNLVYKENTKIPDERYLNVSVEQIDYTPHLLME